MITGRGSAVERRQRELRGELDGLGRRQQLIEAALERLGERRPMQVAGA